MGLLRVEVIDAIKREAICPMVERSLKSFM
jgi:hypothetical protein